MDTILCAPETQDEGVWKYEHLRQFCMELNGLAVKLHVCSLAQIKSIYHKLKYFSRQKVVLKYINMFKFDFEWGG